MYNVPYNIIYKFIYNIPYNFNTYKLCITLKNNYKIFNGENCCRENSDHTYVPLFKILEKLTGKERRQNKFKPFCVFCR